MLTVNNFGKQKNLSAIGAPTTGPSTINPRTLSLMGFGGVLGGFISIIGFVLSSLVTLDTLTCPVY